MESQEMVKQALETKSDLKLIMKGEVLTEDNKKLELLLLSLFQKIL